MFVPKRSEFEPTPEDIMAILEARIEANEISAVRYFAEQENRRRTRIAAYLARRAARHA